MVKSEELAQPIVQAEAGELLMSGRMDADGIFWLQLFGELDLAAAETFTEVLASPEAEGCPLIIDLSGLDFIDSTGVACLLRANTRAELQRRDLRFMRGPEAIERTFHLTYLDRMLRFVD